MRRALSREHRCAKSKMQLETSSGISDGDNSRQSPLALSWLLSALLEALRLVAAALILALQTLVFPSPTPAAAASEEQLTVAVVGASLSGLVAAYALARDGFEVHLYDETVEQQPGGGTLDAIEWADGATTSAVPAWRRRANHAALLRMLGARTSHAEARALAVRADGEWWAHDELASSADADGGYAPFEHLPPLRVRYAADLRRWRRLVRHMRAVNRALGLSGAASSSYSASPLASALNPLHLVPLRVACFFYGVSSAFGREVLVPLYSACLLSASFATLPASFAPLLDDALPTGTPPLRETWSHDVQPPRELHRLLCAGVHVHSGAVVLGVGQRADGRWSVRCAGRGAKRAAEQPAYDRLILAAGARAASAVLPARPFWAVHHLLFRSACFTEANGALRCGVAHSDLSVVPEEHRAAVAAGVAQYASRDASGALQVTVLHSAWLAAAADAKRIAALAKTWPSHGAGRASATPMVLASTTPTTTATKRLRNGRPSKKAPRLSSRLWASGPGNVDSDLPRLVTYGLQRKPANVVGEVELDDSSHPHVSLASMATAMLLRRLQGRRGVFFSGPCTSLALPTDNFDATVCSGLAAAAAIGARHPFCEDEAAAADFEDFFRLTFPAWAVHCGSREGEVEWSENFRSTAGRLTWTSRLHT